VVDILYRNTLSIFFSPAGYVFVRPEPGDKQNTHSCNLILQKLFSQCLFSIDGWY